MEITRETSEKQDEEEEEELSQKEDTDEGEDKPKKKKRKGIMNKKVLFYVKDARYEVMKRIGKKEMGWKNTYKDEENCNIIWSDIGLQPERLQNMKPFQ